MERHTARRFYRISHFKNIRSKTYKRFTKKRLKRPRCKTENKKKQQFAIADSGSLMTFFNEKTAKSLQTRFKYLPPEDAARKLTCYNVKQIITKRRFFIAVESECWTI